MTTQSGCITLAGVASLVMLVGGAEAATCSYQVANGDPVAISGSTTTTVQGQPACTIDMASYAALCPTGTGITSTGYAICEESFAQAMHDAAEFFLTSTNATQTYLVTIAPGIYDYSSEIGPLPGQTGAVDVSGIAPSGAGCIQYPSVAGEHAISGSGCLVIEGAGSTSTTLVSASATHQVFGRDASHVMVEGLTFVQPDLTETQGTILPAPNGVGTKSIKGVTFATVTLDIAPGFPTPDALFAFNCSHNTQQPHHRDGCTKSASPPYATNAVYFRAYDNATPREPVPTTSESRSSGQNNEQVSWGYPRSKTGKPLSYEKPVRLPHSSTWTLVLSQPLSQQVVPDAVQDPANLICLKVDGPGSFAFLGGTDIIFAGVTWIGGTRGVFRGVNGSPTGFPFGAQVYDSTLQPNVIRGALACLSQAGGLQFGQPDDPPIYGNVVYGVTATSTGDDSIAFFNDIGTGATQSVVEQTTITGSNDRSIMLSENPSRILSTNPDCPGVGTASGSTGHHRKPQKLLPCRSPVYVDAFTQQNIAGCNPLGKSSLVTPGVSQCPVFYAP